MTSENLIRFRLFKPELFKKISTVTEFQKWKCFSERAEFTVKTSKEKMSNGKNVEKWRYLPRLFFRFSTFSIHTLTNFLTQKFLNASEIP